MVNYLRDTGAAVGIRAVLGVVLLIVVVAFFLLPSKANASDFEYLSSGFVRVGVDSSFRPQSVQCYPAGASSKLTSNIMLGTSLVRKGRVDLSAYYRHNSCAVNRDRNSYDGAGIELEVKLW
jgi:hypothetical protein